MLFNWIAEELGARAAPRPRPARSARPGCSPPPQICFPSHRLQRTPSSHRPPPRPDGSPSRLGSLSRPPAPPQTEPEDTQKDTTSPLKRHVSTDTQRHDSSKNGSHQMTQVSLWKVKKCQDKKDPMDHKRTQMYRIHWKPTLLREHITLPLETVTLEQDKC